MCNVYAAIEISSPFGSVCLFVYADKLTISSGTVLASYTAFPRLWGISDIFERLNCLLQSYANLLEQLRHWIQQCTDTHTHGVITVIWCTALSATLQVTSDAL